MSGPRSAIFGASFPLVFRSHPTTIGCVVDVLVATGRDAEDVLLILEPPGTALGAFSSIHATLRTTLFDGFAPDSSFQQITRILSTLKRTLSKVSKFRRGQPGVDGYGEGSMNPTIL